MAKEFLYGLDVYTRFEKACGVRVADGVQGFGYYAYFCMIRFIDSPFTLVRTRSSRRVYFPRNVLVR